MDWCPLTPLTLSCIRYLILSNTFPPTNCLFMVMRMPFLWMQTWKRWKSFRKQVFVPEKYPHKIHDLSDFPNIYIYISYYLQDNLMTKWFYKQFRSKLNPFDHIFLSICFHRYEKRANQSIRIIFFISHRIYINPEIVKILVSVHISRYARKYFHEMKEYQKYSIYLLKHIG